ncbi:GntR family transcriptional regulator [Coraliomargarita sp. SDUM461004]|uniref:GntR family transcriptional regulator n=1 Tax=Thalassobacterium sedimentorum TaxID=3041258 RepID=A0ABU1ALA6_9BACT|nr:GntR family transcriptional regulator [Coraliomargarita sp. SDUM461004]MDQ8195581.1 GntR family transcriptional regulator [Coraliomargarita sp. SDUM461004]
MKAKKNGSYKYTELAECLKTKINTAASGTRLPSVRALMKRYSLSMQTVILAIKQLEDENLVVRRQGSGIYVSDQRSMRYIVYHRSRSPSRNNDAKEVSLHKAVQAEGWYLSTRRHDFGIETIINEPRACAHVVNQDVVVNEMGFLDQILQQGVPVVFLGREPGEYDTDFVTGNDRQIFLSLVKHFKQLGHSQFGFLVNEPPLFEILQRKEILNEVLQTLKLPPPITIDCHAKQGELSAEKAYIGLKKFLATHHTKLPFTALLTASENGGLTALRAFHEYGISIPTQCSLGTFGCKIENQWSVPSITDVGLSVDDWGRSTIKVIKERFAGDTSPSFGVRMPCHITVRESSAPPPSNFAI